MRHPVRVQPSGHDTLEVRQRYLRKRRSRTRDTRRVAVWIAFGAVACWLGVVGFVVLLVGSR